LARPYLDGPPVPVRGILFDKSPDANWLVPWHQDLTIAVRERFEAEGFSAWSKKDGIPHVQPPVALLEQMLTIRLHLDGADETNGALRIISGTHRLGKLSAGEAASARAERSEHVCCVQAGDAVLMRPLVLHASSKARSPKHRRVLHLEYAGFDLPVAMAWHSAALESHS
jgi:ectoine hydroxylase-related dioxygenase (phytanoyl-CoA dioxygenase family)